MVEADLALVRVVQHARRVDGDAAHEAVATELQGRAELYASCPSP